MYWRRLGNGDIDIATILHERMYQIDRFKDDYMQVFVKKGEYRSKAEPQEV